MRDHGVGDFVTRAIFWVLVGILVIDVWSGIFPL